MTPGTVEVPAGATPIYLHSKKAKMLSRVELGDDPGYTNRTVVNLLGIWANTADEVVYFNASVDADGKPLSGAHSYVTHFAADNLPASVVDGYWSVILVSIPDFRVIPNPLHRYNFNSHSPLTFEADGSCGSPPDRTRFMESPSRIGHPRC